MWVKSDIFYIIEIVCNLKMDFKNILTVADPIHLWYFRKCFTMGRRFRLSEL